MTQPLAGVTIADFSHVMAGPYASHLLSLLGAKVIKIEPKIGDAFRNYGGDRRFDGMSPAFLAANAGKKSIALDLKDDDDLTTAREIIARSDVVLENFRPGVMARLGLGYDDACKLRPGVIFCSVSGYGQEGPQRDWPAIDNIVQATAGVMMLSGAEGDPPVRVGFPIVDTLTGQSAALAILAALMRQRETGEGGHLDVSMFDASLAFTTAALTPFLVTGQSMPRIGNTGYSGLPTASMFKARDGRLISLGVVQPKQFDSLARFLNREEWLEDPRFADADAQRANFDALTEEVASVIATRDAAVWEAEMSAASIPCGMVRRVDEAVSLAGEGAFIKMPIEGIENLEQLTLPGLGFRFVGEEAAEVAAPPSLDQDRKDILNWLKKKNNGI